MANVKNSILQLKRHQLEAYNNCIELYEKQEKNNERQKAAVVFPTGCGKSFVILKYILEHPDERILFLAPRNAIKDQMYEYVVRYIGGDQREKNEIINEFGSFKNAARKYVPNFRCDLYQSMLGYGKKDSETKLIDRLKPDMIIVDEMHHLKTKSMRDKNNIVFNEEDEQKNENEWGKKFLSYLEKNSQAKLLGLTATPIRNDNANVVERLFEDALAEEISLLDAIELGIIHPPKYVVPDFIGKDEMETLLQKIENEKGERKETLQKKYDELVKESTKIEGLSNVLKENIMEHDPKGKYIIFCKDIEDMENKKEQAKEWFGEIDENPEIYAISSKDKTSQKQLQDFSETTSDHLKLMYCVGMIDEGVHIDDVSGVILAAKTGSRPTYFQRIGRAISVGEVKKQSIVIDLVNNNEILVDKTKKQDGFELTDLEALEKLVQWVEEKNNGKIPEYDEESSTKERIMAKRFARLNNKYLKYELDDKLLNDLDNDLYDEYRDIIKLGKTIGMFQGLVKLDIEENDNIKEELNTFVRNVEIKGLRRNFIEILSNNNELTPFEEVLQFCVKEGRVPSQIHKQASEQTEKEKREKSLYGKWVKSEEKKIIDSYTGKSLEEIPEEHRALVKQFRNYGYGLNPFEEVLQFCVDKERVPSSTNKPASEQTEEEKRENSLYVKWKRSKEKKIIDSYTGKSLEEIPEEHRTLVEQFRNYGYGKGSGLTPFEEVLQFCVDKERVPSSIHKLASEQTEEEKREQGLYDKWKRSEEKKIIDSYTGKILEEIPEEHRELVEKIRGYGYGLNPFEEVLKFCEDEKNRRVPAYINKPASEQTEEEKRENSLYVKWKRSEEKKIIDSYTGKSLEEIPEEHRALVEQFRNYGYGKGSGLTPFEEVLQFCVNKERVPSNIHKLASEQTEEEKREKSLYEKWKRSEEKKIIDSYTGKNLEEIPEEHRELVEKIRGYGYFGRKTKTVKELVRKVGKEISIEENSKAKEFLESISCEKQIEGEKNDPSGNIEL